MTIQITVSLKKDEVEGINTLMTNLNLNRHQVVKLAIRRFLFPTEISSIPLDGAYAEITGLKHLDDLHKRITVTKDGEKKTILKRVER